jgi:adenine-specific DNA-methyltransferase
VKDWFRTDEPILLLRLPKTRNLSSAVLRYLNTDQGKAAQGAYKCRTRDPWYSVPDVQVPDFFLSYMSGTTPNLVFNAAGCTCTNSVHSLRIRDRRRVGHLVRTWDTAFVKLSCELEGHALGGGMLKVEPREAAQIVLPPQSLFPEIIGPTVDNAIRTMRSWRHYAA